MKVIFTILTLSLLQSTVVTSIENEAKISLNDALDELSQKSDMEYGIEMYCDEQENKPQIFKKSIDTSILKKDSLSEILESIESVKNMPFKITYDSNNSNTLLVIQDSLLECESYVLNMAIGDFTFTGTKNELVAALRKKGVKIGIGFVYIYPSTDEDRKNEAKIYSFNLKECTVRDVITRILLSNETRNSFHVCAYHSSNEETLVLF